MEFDRVDCFDKISVRVPREWAEGQSEGEGFYEFFDPNGKSGTLRVSLFSHERNEPCSAEALQNEDFEYRQEEGVRFFRVDDYVAAEWSRPGKEETDVMMFYWTVSAVVGKRLTRRAFFSYAVDTSRTKDADFPNELKMVRDCVFAVHFMPESVN